MILRRVSLFLLAATAFFQQQEQASSFQLFPGGGGGGGSLTTTHKRSRRTVSPAREKELQKTLGIPDGLMKSLLDDNNAAFSKRIWIVDNSGSMAMADGHQLISPNVDCTRWKELEETVLLHAQLSSALHAPTEFRLLNNGNDTGRGGGGSASSFRVGYGTMRNGLKQAQTVLSSTKPAGSTPLPESIAKIRREIIGMLPELKADGTKVAIVIVTDGCHHSLKNMGQEESEINQELSQALKSLQGLPVSVVVRLCTDYGPLVDFYNELDESLDGVDVIDDYTAEAKEVYQHNPWLNYALIIHRMREMGHHSQLFDWLDERTLTRDELKEFCGILFGKQQRDLLPDPNEDWQGFLKAISRLQSREKLHLNPRTQQMAPWIDIKGLAMLE